MALFYYEELTLQEISEVLEITEYRAVQIYSEAMSKLDVMGNDVILNKK